MYGLRISPRPNDYIPKPLTNDSSLYLPGKYTINSPTKLVRAINVFLKRLGLNISKRFKYMPRILLEKINWSSYGFNNMDTVDYIWHVLLDLYRGKYVPSNAYLFLSISFSALTGAVVNVQFSSMDFYKLITRYPDIVVNKSWFQYIIKPHRFENSMEAYSFFKKLFWVLNIRRDIYGSNYIFYFNYSYPAYITVIFQAVNNRPIINTGPHLYMNGIFDSVSIYYYNDTSIRSSVLSAIFVSLFPIRYAKIVSYYGKIELDKIVRYSIQYVREKFNISSDIPVEYYRSIDAYYLIAPWTLKEFYIVDLHVKTTGKNTIILVIDPSNMRVYDYAILPNIIKK